MVDLGLEFFFGEEEVVSPMDFAWAWCPRGAGNGVVREALLCQSPTEGGLARSGWTRDEVEDSCAHHFFQTVAEVVDLSVVSFVINVTGARFRVSGQGLTTREGKLRVSTVDE